MSYCFLSRALSLNIAFVLQLVMSSEFKVKLAREKLMELQSNHRPLQHSTESSMVRILEILQHYHASFLVNSDEVTSRIEFSV